MKDETVLSVKVSALAPRTLADVMTAAARVPGVYIDHVWSDDAGDTWLVYATAVR